MAWLCTIKYIAYFYDKEIFDSSPNDGQDPVEIYIGDIAWPEGLWRGLQNMRKDEKAKIRMKKKFAFGRPGELDKLRFPIGYSTCEADQARREKLLNKGVIYEVTLVDFVERNDIDQQGNIFK